jgi:hypothetical protein
MTTPNEPPPNTSANGNATPGSVNPKIDLVQKATDIADVVERDRRRRRRTTKIMLSFIVLTLALAGAVLAFGRSDQKVMRDTVTQQVGVTVDQQAPVLITKEVEKQLPVTIDTRVSPIITQTVEERIETEVTPELNNLASQIAAMKIADYPASGTPFSTAEVGQIKKAIWQDFPAQTVRLATLSTQVRNLKDSMGGEDAQTWNKERLGVTNRLGSLESEMSSRVNEFKRISQKLAELEQLSQKLSAALKKLDPQATDPCLHESQLEAKTFRTYSVKENTTSRLYDLNFKIKVKDRKDGVVRGLTIRRGDVELLREQDVMMGITVSFDDNNFNYSLTPVFVNKRVLANDFIGLAISRSRKCTPPK